MLTLLLILMVGGVTAYLLYQRAKPSSAPSSSGGGTGTPSKPSGSGVAATPSSSSSSSSSSDNSATSEFAKNALDAHNSVRATHGAPDFTYNDTLASAADKWAHVCEWEHSGGKVGPYGENLFMVRWEE